MTDSIQLTRILRESMEAITHHAFHEHMQFVKASGISMPQFSILMQVHYQRQCGISDIGNRMEITSAAASQLVDKLVQAEFLERSEDPHDRRAKQLKLSPKGHQLIETGLAARHQWVENLVGQIDQADWEKVAEVMAILTRNLQKSPGKAPITNATKNVASTGD